MKSQSLKPQAKLNCCLIVAYVMFMFFVFCFCVLLIPGQRQPSNVERSNLAAYMNHSIQTADAYYAARWKTSQNIQARYIIRSLLMGKVHAVYIHTVHKYYLKNSWSAAYDISKTADIRFWDLMSSLPTNLHIWICYMLKNKTKLLVFMTMCFELPNHNPMWEKGGGVGGFGHPTCYIHLFCHASYFGGW